MTGKKSFRIGIDVGALYLKAVRVDENGSVLKSFCRAHRAAPESVLDAALSEIGATEGDVLGLTGSGAGRVAETLGAAALDITRCQREAVARVLPGVAFIMDIGGASATLVQLDAEGRFQGYATNSLCAAGTGSFLDEQAARLGISYDDTESYGRVEEPPSIATRCAVFAKSDLIHRQQEGYGKPDMWSGLCRGMTRTLLATLLCGRPLDGPVAVIGGVARNREVIRWLDAAWPGLMRVPTDPHLVAATGAAMLATDAFADAGKGAKRATRSETVDHYAWPLTLEKSRFPSFATEESYVDEDGSEVRVIALRGLTTNDRRHTTYDSRPTTDDTRLTTDDSRLMSHASCLPSVRGFLGVDIGSTSTKLALVGEDGEIILDVYRKTAGDPIGATRLLFKALRQLGERRGVAFEILGVGTTGSGRKIVGAVIGADAIINEISAHVAGAVRTDPKVDTIFEIGGQDSKYMHVVDGHIRNANMNYVCAAGTGSFVEEQANKLGYPVARVGEAVQGLRPPRATDRCTVFMEQDVERLMQSGASREEALSAVMVSVVKNYLNKVVGNRHRSRERIFFQGATARNPALVAAFERLLGVEVVVSLYCHVMGAYGVALLTMERMGERSDAKSTFRGLDLETRRIGIRKDVCRLCTNECSITFADIEGVAESPSWGYSCGRDPAENRRRHSPHERLVRLRRKLFREAGGAVKLPRDAPVAGIPDALAIHSFMPLWRAFFGNLGVRVVSSGETSDEVRDLGNRITGAEFCFPAKVALGHVAALAKQSEPETESGQPCEQAARTRPGCAGAQAGGNRQSVTPHQQPSEGAAGEQAGRLTPGGGKVDFVFVPQMAAEPSNPHTTASTFCPYVQGLPSCARSALSVNGIDASRIVSPIVDMRADEDVIIRALHKALAGRLDRSERAIRRAWREGLAAQREFAENCRAAGRKAMAEARKKGEKLLVLVGRPYNLFDKGINLDLPRTIADQGMTVLPLEFLDLDYSRLVPRYRNIYWSYGQKILAALETVSRSDVLEAVYLTNFSCGPDSFLLSYAEEIMGSRPFLALELDEHGSDAGYQTRIEAFFDVLKRAKHTVPRRRACNPGPKEFRDRTVWLPPMHEFGTPFITAAFRRHGYDARTLSDENRESFELGRSVTRGSECLPTALTIGTFLKALRGENGSGRHVLFMPTAQGPCRFGQYCTLHRQILDREGHSDVAILSPSSANAYQGVDEPLRRSLFRAVLAADILLKTRCKVRPYEKDRGETDARVATASRRIVSAIESGGDLRTAVASAVAEVAATPQNGSTPKPVVGIVGEIYVRNNNFANEDVIGSIERFGGEAWMTPIAEWLMYTSSPKNLKQHSRNPLAPKEWKTVATHMWMRHLEHRYYSAAGEFLRDRIEPEIAAVMDLGAEHMPVNIGGEAVLIIGRTIAFRRQGAAMVVNCAPFGCMPGVATTAIFRRLSADLDMPIVNMFYDGNGNQNRRLEVFLNNAVRK
jgi:predicted CoA-substrate-specific enzyme activase